MQSIRNLDLNLLRSLDVLFATSNVSKAAVQLRIAQSTLSAQLARLRQIFGDDLLVPSESGRGLALTPRSVELKVPVRELMAQIDGIVSGSAERAGTATTKPVPFNIAVAASDGASLSLVARCIGNLKESVGRAIPVSVRQIQRREFVGLLERGAADVLIARQNVVPEPLKSKALATETFVIAQRKGHPRGTHPYTVEEFCELPQVVPLAPSRQSSPIDEAMSFLNLQRNIALEADSPFVTLEILGTTDYIAAVPSRIIKNDAFDVFPMPFCVPPLSICMSWHTRTHHDTRSKWLREQLCGAAKQQIPRA